MNPSPEAVTNETLAKLVVGDSIREAYTNPTLARGATVEDMNDLLNSHEADIVVQGIMATYTASEFAAVASGELLGLDKRLVQDQVININARGLKLELRTELKRFLDLTDIEKQSYVAGFLAKTVS